MKVPETPTRNYKSYFHSQLLFIHVQWPRNVIDFSIWKERNYRIWATGVPLGMFGYFVPFFHLVKHVNDTLPDARAEVLIMCLGATSGIGRLVSGFLSDHPKINPIYIQQIAFLVIGVSTTLMPVIRNFGALCALILFMGIFDGAFVSMIGPIAFNLVGPQRASQAIGCVLGLMSIPMMIGPPVAGLIYDIMGTYDIAFICSGIPPIVAACILFLIRPDHSNQTNDDDDEKDKVGAESEKESEALMVPRGTTPSMAAKETEAMMDRDSPNAEMWKGGLRGGRVEDGGFESGAGYEDERGRRRSYRRDRMSLSDTRLIMQTHPPHEDSNHNGVVSNGDVYRFKGVYSNGVLGNTYGVTSNGNRSPYAQRNRNMSNHLNGDVPGSQKIELNGLIHRSDSHSAEVVGKLLISERETTV